MESFVKTSLKGCFNYCMFLSLEFPSFMAVWFSITLLLFFFFFFLPYGEACMESVECLYITCNFSLMLKVAVTHLQGESYMSISEEQKIRNMKYDAEISK